MTKEEYFKKLHSIKIPEDNGTISRRSMIAGMNYAIAMAYHVENEKKWENIIKGITQISKMKINGIHIGEILEEFVKNY